MQAFLDITHCSHIGLCIQIGIYDGLIGGNFFFHGTDVQSLAIQFLYQIHSASHLLYDPLILINCIEFFNGLVDYLRRHLEVLFIEGQFRPYDQLLFLVYFHAFFFQPPDLTLGVSQTFNKFLFEYGESHVPQFFHCTFGFAPIQYPFNIFQYYQLIVLGAGEILFRGLDYPSRGDHKVPRLCFQQYFVSKFRFGLGTLIVTLPEADYSISQERIDIDNIHTQLLAFFCDPSGALNHGERFEQRIGFFPRIAEFLYLIAEVRHQFIITGLECVIHCSEQIHHGAYVLGDALCFLRPKVCPFILQFCPFMQFLQFLYGGLKILYEMFRLIDVIPGKSVLHFQKLLVQSRGYLHTQGQYLIHFFPEFIQLRLYLGQ